MKIKNNYNAAINIHSNKLNTLYKSILVGIIVGFVVSFYRYLLTEAEKLSFLMYHFIRSHILIIPLAFILLGFAGYLIGLLISKYSMISGSGIPQVKGNIMGYLKHNWISTLLAKFLGGTISILAGLSLGREGPSIQLGACVAQGVGNKFGTTRTERKILIASGASAGLAAAFNAPLAGTIFVIEEIFKYISPVILLSTMTSAVVSDFISRLIFGSAPIFHFHVEHSIPLSGYWLLFILGLLLGALGAFYNFILIHTQKLYKKLFPIKIRPVIPFMISCSLGLTFPIVLCGGHAVTEKLQLTSGITFLLVVLLIKFIFSMISFGSGAPGGIFFPLLIIGATIGAITGNIAVNYLGFDSGYFYNFLILAMAGYFTAIVRAPITGIILLTEMTGSFTQLLSLTFVSILAYVVADLLKSVPIYDSLLENLIADKKREVTENDKNRKITIELVIHYGSYAENKLVKEINFPPNCLLIAVKREGTELIPNGKTRILAEDLLVFITNISDETATREKLDKFSTNY